VKTDKKTTFIVVLLVVNLLGTALLAVYVLLPMRPPQIQSALEFTESENGQYILYIGINDKDVYEQLIPTDEARNIVNGICAKYVEGYTANDAQGGWVDETGTLTQENTLMYTFTGATEAQIIPLMDEVLAALNQNSILVERRGVSSAFYDGSAAP
jgi:hypothetical protein